MTIEVLSPGLYTTIQDLGRRGFQHNGISPGGVMDTFSHRIANILVGNDESFATIEMTLTGAKLKFNQTLYIAITGADLTPTIDGYRVENWRKIKVEKGSILTFKKRQSGCRGYLAVSGGFKGDKWLGSSSTSLQVKLGGYKGRTLKQHDVLEVNDSNNLSFDDVVNWKVSPHLYRFYEQRAQLQVIKGKQFDQFTKKTVDQFFNQLYSVSVNSNRMGYRLEGVPLTRKDNQSLISEGVSNGTVQIPADGKPIILMADRQTIGGYPKLAQVITVDLAKLAQCVPGERVGFSLVSLEEAHRKYCEIEKEISQLKVAVKLKGGRYR
jgi:antagonist of KipI